jgi:hypothetical protein
MPKAISPPHPPASQRRAGADGANGGRHRQGYDPRLCRELAQMSLGWVVAGTFGQGMLGMWMFMLVAFSGGGIANGNSLTKGQELFLDIAILALPASCAVSAIAVIYLYITDAGATAYWWYAMPVALMVLYCVYALYLLPRRLAAANAGRSTMPATRPSSSGKKKGRKKRPGRS